MSSINSISHIAWISRRPVGFKAGGGMKKSPTMKLLTKRPSPWPVFLFFWWKGHKLFFRVHPWFPKTEVQRAIAKRWETESPYPKFALQESLSFLLGVPIELTKFHGLFERPKNQPQKMKDKQPFFLSSSLHNRGIGTSEFPAFNLSESISVRKWSQHEFALICIFRGWVAKFSELIYISIYKYIYIYDAPWVQS